MGVLQSGSALRPSEVARASQELHRRKIDEVGDEELGVDGAGYERAPPVTNVRRALHRHVIAVRQSTHQLPQRVRVWMMVGVVQRYVLVLHTEEQQADTCGRWRVARPPPHAPASLASAALEQWPAQTQRETHTSIVGMM